MTNPLYVLVAVFGLILGSFLNVVILRDQKRKSILTDRSRCPHCGTVLSWYELIPVVSYLIQQGKCRTCHKPISLQYPVVELLSAGLVVFATWYGVLEGQPWWFAAGIGLSLLLLLVVSVIDFRTMELPIEYVVAAGAIGGLSHLVTNELTIFELGLGVATGAGLIAFITYGWKFLFKKEGMGTGDIWMAGAVGAIVGYPLVIVSLFAAVMIGSVIGVILVGVSKKGLETRLPFGPFLFAGMLVALVWGQALLDWYIL